MTVTRPRPKPLPPSRVRRPVTVVLGDGQLLEPTPADEQDVNVDPPQFSEIDLESDEGQIILQLTDRIDYLEQILAERSGLTFSFRSALGRDQVVPLPVRAAGQTELVLTGVPYADEVGHWDLQQSPFAFAWENPDERPMPMPRCAVTGDGCAHIGADFGYCRLCPGLSDEFRETLAVIGEGV